MPSLELFNYGSGHLALVGEGLPRVDFDPALPAKKKKRDDALEALTTDVIVVTRGDSDARQDAIDAVDGTHALLVGPSALTNPIDKELDLGEGVLDLDDWERGKAGPWRFLHVPSPGRGLVNDLIGSPTDIFQTSEFMGRTLSSLPMLGDLSRGLPSSMGMGRSSATRAVVVVDREGAPTVAFLGDALTGAADRDWIEDVAETVKPEIVVAAVHGAKLDALVWAVREWGPKQVVLYRDHDPYEDSDGLPMARFLDALSEDAPDVAVTHLRTGERLALA
jgi:hypothetical protein